MISMEEFAAYSPFDQHMCICDQGVCLQGKQEGFYEVYLYSIQKFFVEVRYQPVTEKFDPMVIFKDGPRLEGYLAEISLPATLY